MAKRKARESYKTVHATVTGARQVELLRLKAESNYSSLLALSLFKRLFPHGIASLSDRERLLIVPLLAGRFGKSSEEMLDLFTSSVPRQRGNLMWRPAQIFGPTAVARVVATCEASPRKRTSAGNWFEANARWIPPDSALADVEQYAKWAELQRSKTRSGDIRNTLRRIY